MSTPYIRLLSFTLQFVKKGTHLADKPSLKKEQPKAYGFWKTVLIVLCGHIGVRPSKHRQVDFECANGVHVFVVAVIYFLLVIFSLIMLVNYIVK